MSSSQIQFRQIEAVLDGMIEGVLIVAASGDVIRANPAAIQILGDLGSPEVRTLDGRPVSDEDRPVSKALRGETFSGLVLEIRREDTGLHRIVSHSATPLYDDAGKVSFAVVILHDITQLRHAEGELQRTLDALRESQERFRRLAVCNMLDIAVF